MQRSRRGARLALALGTVVLVLAIAELGMRVLGIGEVMVYRRDARFGYLMEPNQVVSTYGEKVRINALGLRGPEVSAEAAPGVHRAVLLGDSVTYGGGRIAEADLFCRRLEALARRDGISLEAVNVSAPAWSPQNWAAWVRAHGLLDAGVVVPVLPAIDRARPFATLEFAALVERKPPLRLVTIAMRMRAELVPGRPHDDEALRANVAALKQVLAVAAGRPVLGVLIPSRNADAHPEHWRPFEALLPDAVDLRGALSEEDYFDAVHLDVRGHRVVAEAIYPRLREIVRRR